MNEMPSIDLHFTPQSYAENLQKAFQRAYQVVRQNTDVQIKRNKFNYNRVCRVISMLQHLVQMIKYVYLSRVRRYHLISNFLISHYSFDISNHKENRCLLYN